MYYIVVVIIFGFLKIIIVQSARSPDIVICVYVCASVVVVHNV